MKSFLMTAALVLVAIWVWSKLSAKPAAKKSKGSGMEMPVDTGTFFGPFIDSKTGAYLAPGDTPGMVQYGTQPVGIA